jgi:hypothetical protein
MGMGMGLASVGFKYAATMQGAGQKQAAAAAEYGIKTANIDHQAAMKMEASRQSLVAIEESRIAESIQVDQQGAAAEANARVTAAVTGAQGDSVEQTLTQVDINMANSRNQVDEIAERQKQKVYNDMVDLGVSSDMSKGIFTKAGNMSFIQKADLGLSLVNAYDAGNGFNKDT